jgi:hypothetical protein
LNDSNIAEFGEPSAGGARVATHHLSRKIARTVLYHRGTGDDDTQASRGRDRKGAHRESGYEFSRLDAVIAISNLNTCNFTFIMAGLPLHWRPKRFLAAVGRAVPASAGVLVQFPLYGAIAMILTQAKNGAGVTVSDQIAHTRCRSVGSGQRVMKRARIPAD